MNDTSNMPDIVLAPVCPRCGGPMRHDENLNPLSRHRFERICRDCGTDEAFRDLSKPPMPYQEWSSVRRRREQGEEVFEVNMTRTGSVLVVASSGEEAMTLARSIPDEYIGEDTDWEPTDYTPLEEKS